MTEAQFKDLTRKAMIREYLLLQNQTIRIIDHANEIHGLIENYYQMSPKLYNKYIDFDRIVDSVRIYR